MATSPSQSTSRDPWAEFTEIEPAPKASGKFWENDPVVDDRGANGPQWPGTEVTSSGQSGASLRPIFTVPDPKGEREEARDVRGEERAEESLNITRSGEERQGAKDRLQMQLDVGTKFDAQPQVQAYREGLTYLMTGLQTEPNGSGDSTLITSYAKVMDPGGVVNEGEREAASGTGSFVQQRVAELRNILSNEGSLPDAVRANLREEMNRKMVQNRRAYLASRQRFEAIAKANDLDPELILGPDDFEPYREEYRGWFEARNGGNDPRAASTREAVNSGEATVRLGMDKWGDVESAWDRAEYLRETYGITGDQEARLTTSLNQLRGQDVTATQIASIYGQLGIPLPGDAELSTMADSLKQGHRFSGIDTESAQQAYEGALDQVLEQRGSDPESVSGAVGINAAQGLTFNLGDEIAGVGGFIKAGAKGQNPITGYQAERDVIRREQDRAREARPITSAVSELAGGVATGALVPGRYVKSATDAAKAAAAEGALYGFGSGEGLEDSALRAGAGAATGATLGYAVGRASEKLAARRANSAPSQGSEMIAASDRLNDLTGSNIRPLPADVAGPGVRNASGGMGKMPISAGLIVRQANRTTEEAEKAKNAIASLAGTAQEVEAAGETALKGAQAYMKRSRAKVNTLYEKARKLGGDRPVDLVNARAVLDDHIAELSQTPGGAKGLERMRKLRAELDQPYPVEGVKRMRTSLNDEFLNDGLTGSDLERRMRMVADAADDDITDSLVAAGSEGAARAYRQAADAHKERLEVIETVLDPFIGRKGADPKSGEEVVLAIEAATKRRSAKLGKFMAALPKEDAATVRATLIDRLGKPTAGSETAESTFSLDRFLTQWQGMTDRAKGAMFGGELRKALDDLATVASGRKEARKFVNFPNTGSAIGTLASGGALVGAATNPWWLGLSALDALGGALLSSPKVARLLARTKNPQSAMSGLEKIARAEPAIATEVLGLHKAISDTLTVGATRTAAEPATDQDAGLPTTGVEMQ